MIRKTAILTLIAVCCTALTYAQLANFTAASTSGCSPLVVNFQDLSSGSPATWFWDFGNGGTSTLQNPSATYFVPGTYTVKLTVTNAQGTNTLTRTEYINVYGKPSINFTVNDNAACFPHPAQFTDLSVASPGTTNTQWLWDFGDGTQSTEQNPLHVYTQSGNYTVNLKVTNDKGCYSVFTRQSYIVIAGGVETDFTGTQPTICKPPINISFTNNSTGPGTLTYLWDFGDGNTSTQQNPSHNYTAPGNYTVFLSTTSSGGCTDTLSKVHFIKIADINTVFEAPDSICINSNISFLNTSSPAPDSSTWFFGDGQMSTETNPVKSFGALGTFPVRLINQYTYCADTFTKNIRVLPRPVAAFTSDVRFRCQPPHQVNFQDQSSNAVGWLWDFGDGNTSTQRNPTHTYTGYGNFDVQLIVTNTSGCTDTLLIPEYIRVQRPVISFPSLPARGCVPFTIAPVASINTLDAVTSYLWNFGDGNTSTLPNPSHTYPDQGTYAITLTITTSSGCTETYTMGDAVKVGRKPIVDFTAGPTPVCAFQSVQFNNLTNESDQWYWDFGDGTSSAEENPTHQYTDTGLFTITFYAINNGCTDSLTKVDYIRIKPPIARFGYETTCTNRRLFQFRDSSIGATSWLWNFGDGTTSTDQNPVHLFPDFTNYNVTLTVSNDTCSHSVTRIISVITESPDFTANPNPVCRANTVYFTASGITTANIATYEWDLGFGNFVSTTSPTIFNFYNDAGVYDITLVTTDKYGCKDTTVKQDYLVITGPKANFIATNNRGCAGLTTTFNDLTLTDGTNNIVSWKWDFGDGTTQTFTSAPFQHTYTTADTFSVRLTVTDAGGCMDSIFYQNVVITSDPNPDFVADDTLSCPGGIVRFFNFSTASTNFTSHWDFGDGSTASTFHNDHSFQNTGYYTVKLRITDQFGCMDSIVKPQYIRVDRPVAGFTVNDSISSCTPFEVRFTQTSQYYHAWLWDLGTGMSTINEPTTFYNSPGVYPVRLVVTSKGNCKDTAYANITVIDTAGSKIDYLPLNGCKPLGIDFSAYSPGRMDQYTWDFGDGVLITEQDTATTHIYNSFGNFVPKVILTDPAGCIIPVTGIDTIRIKGATVKFGMDSSFFCDRGMVTFIDSTTFNDSISVYHWDFGDGNTSNLQNPVHYYDSPGWYNVTLNVQTQDACVDTFHMNQAIKIVESPSVRIGGDTVICINDFLEHLGEFQQPDTSLVQWNWQFPNGNTSLLQNPDAQQYGQTGIFTVTTIATNSSGCRDTATKNILVNPLPQVTLPSTMTMQAGFPVTIPAEYSSNVMGYNWTPDATLNCNDCPQPIASPKFNTNYTVAFVDSNGCRNTGQVQIIVICKDANVFIPNTFSPNGDGSNDVFYVRGRGLERVKSLRIFNRWGEVVYEQQQFPVNNPAFGWNGKYKGKNALPDVYVYQVEVFCDNSQLIRFEGNVALIQ